MAARLQRLTYVEDELDIRALAEFALREIGGFNIDVCSSGFEALERTVAFKPDMIILDVRMPGMDGIETFRRLRSLRELAHTPVIFMTAQAMNHEIDRYRALGVTDVIVKPFDPLTLPDRIREIWQAAQCAEGQRKAGA